MCWWWAPTKSEDEICSVIVVPIYLKLGEQGKPLFSTGNPAKGMSADPIIDYSIEAIIGYLSLGLNPNLDIAKWHLELIHLNNVLF
jgi:hypothetical protein